MIDKQQLTVAVTGLNANDNPGPGLAVIRCLKAAYGPNIRIIGLAYDVLEPAVYLQEQVDKTYRIPYPAAGTEALMARMNYIRKKENIDVLIPNFDAELYNFIKIEKELLDIGIHTFLPTHKQLHMREKVNLKDFGDQHGFKVPRQELIFKETEINSALEDFGYPVVIKGKFYDAYVAQNAAEAHKAFHRLHAKWGLPVLIQKFIKGTEINIAGLGDGKGEVLSVVPMRKLYITEKGKAWAGITIEDAQLLEVARNFAKASHWKGGFELEIMRQDNGSLYIMEINPRFPAWIYLTAAAGQNQPEALVNLALGTQVTAFESYKTGKMFIRYAWDNIVDVEEFQKLSAFGEL